MNGRVLRRAAIACLTAVVALAALLAVRSSSSEAVPTRLPASSAPSLAPKPGTVRVEARVADPGGDAPWVVRSWITRAEDQVCVQLGREVNGRLGMPAPDGRFLALRFDTSASCSADAFDRKEPLVRVQTFLDDPLAAEPRPLRTVVYGVAGPHARGVVLRAPGDERGVLRSSTRNGFLAVYDGAVRTADVAAEVSYRDGSTFTWDYGRGGRPADDPLRRPARLELTVPDPRGGPAWGALVWEDARGGVCTHEGRVIAGGRVGTIFEDGSFFDHPIGEHDHCEDRARLTREQPLSYGVGGGSGRYWVEDLRRQSRDGRTLPGTTVFSGTARSDVAKVTVEGLGAPLELEPSQRGALLGVVDGARAGRGRVTVTFTDGSRQALPGFSFGGHPPVNSQSRLAYLGPRTVRLTREGVATVSVGCAPGRHKCMGTLWLRSAARFRRSPQGLKRRIRLGSHLFRIGPGTARRPLRIRLSAQNRRLIERRGRLEAVLSAHSDGGRRPQERPVTLLAHTTEDRPSAARAAAAASTPISVSPRTGSRVADFTVRFPLVEALDSNGDYFEYTLRGPGGPDCRSTLEQSFGTSWHPRYNERKRREGVAAFFNPRRLDPNRSGVGRNDPPADLGVWCPGRRSGTVRFRDSPRAEGRRGACSLAQVREGRCRARRRMLGRFSFVVRGVAPGTRMTVPSLIGRRRHSAECLLRERELRWRLHRDRVDIRHRYRPRRPCRERVSRDSEVVGQVPPAGDRVAPGTVVRLTTRRS